MSDDATQLPDTDAELLWLYAEHNSEAAFAEIVRRHVDLVHSAALRQVNGDSHLAADVTQLVFTDLARKAGAVSRYRVLAGWLFTSTRYAAAKAVRTERRRAAREQEAQFMQDMSQDPAARLDWDRVRPVLDGALGELSETDREAILLRFFEGRDYADVGSRFRVSDNTARMRVERALEKLRVLLRRRGVISTSAALAASLGGQAVAAAPTGMAAAVTGAALTNAASTGGAGVIAATFMTTTKLQIGLAGALAFVSVTGLVWQVKANSELRAEVAAVRARPGALESLQTEKTKIQQTARDVRDMRGDDAELQRLNDEAVALNERMQQLTKAERTRAAAAAAAQEVINLSSLDTMPVARFQARPQYPAAVRQMGLGGTVVVEFVVDSAGDVQNARAIRTNVEEKAQEVIKLTPFSVEGPGSPGAQRPSEELTADAAKLLEAAAVEAVGKWKFKAGQKGGRQVNSRMQLPIVFTVSNDAGGSPKN